MFTVDLIIRDVDGQAVVALCGELSLADTPDVAGHLIAAMATLSRMALHPAQVGAHEGHVVLVPLR